MTTTQPHHQPLSTLKVADSIFHGYICTHRSLTSVHQFRQELLLSHNHPDAAHVPYAISIDGGADAAQETFDDDDEPPHANVGKTLLYELIQYKRQLRRQSTMKIRGSKQGIDFDDDDVSWNSNSDDGSAAAACGESGPPIATAIIIVRYFKERLLGVTCGRLISVYARTARLALHRHLHGSDVPYVEKYTFGSSWKNVYGLAAGDTELILDLVPTDEGSSSDGTTTTVEALISELEFEGMVGSKQEVLPRLQNLQADLRTVHNDCSNNSIIPVYRYPGNYSGTEWPTHPWSPTTLSIKHRVEEALQPLYHQHMNHCVSNLYRDGGDRIDHHSDKDLDLNRNGVIVSVSLGSTRFMEVRDRRPPHDVCRVELPPGSMFVLGPETNATFTHAVLPTSNVKKKRGGNSIKCSVEDGGRISLTFRDVRTFLDLKSQRLFGQGVTGTFAKSILVEDGVVTDDSLNEVVERVREEDRKERNRSVGVAVFVGLSVGCVSSREGKRGTEESSDKGGSVTNGMRALLSALAVTSISASASYWYLRRLRSEMRRRREERDARAFFSKKSASGNTY